jgi:serine/threonine-protein kinase SRPK3
MSGTVFDSSPYSAYQASEDLKGLQWPEESLTSTANEGGGFYPARLGETFDDGRFVTTRKLGWGGFSSVWLARDRKYVLETMSLYPQFTGKIKR